VPKALRFQIYQVDATRSHCLLLVGIASLSAINTESGSQSESQSEAEIAIATTIKLESESESEITTNVESESKTENEEGIEIEMVVGIAREIESENNGVAIVVEIIAIVSETMSENEVVAIARLTEIVSDEANPTETRIEIEAESKRVTLPIAMMTTMARRRASDNVRHCGAVCVLLVCN
jgi:hypothetical protein